MHPYAILLVLAIVAGAAAIIWVVKNKTKVDSAINRATTVPSGVVQKVDSVVPGAGTAAANAASQVGAKVAGAVDNATKS